MSGLYQDKWKERKELLNHFEQNPTVETLEKALLVLGEIAGDDESAHSFEDDLRHVVLAAIANGAPDAASLAVTVMRTSTIEFARWCA